MPKLWKYVLGRFAKVMTLTLSGFIAMMLVLRLRDIARFATESGEWSAVGLFMLYQIPYILPIAIPISCLVSAILLMRGLSDDCELTALRAGGFSIFQIYFPVLIASLFLTLGNFYFTSELAPSCRQKARDLAHSTTVSNPLFLLQKHKHLRFDDLDVSMDLVQPRKRAKDLSIAFYSPQSERLGLILMNDLALNDGVLKGKNITLIGSRQAPQGYDHLYIENTERAWLPSRDLACMLRKPSIKATFDALSMRHMLIKAKEDAHRKKTKRRFRFEIIRRVSFALAPLSFTVLGLSYGIAIGRQSERKTLYQAGLIAALLLTCILIGKSFETRPLLALIFYGLPHPASWILAFRQRLKKERGII